MGVGSNGLVSGLSYLAFGRETTFATYSTCTAGLEFLSCSMKSMKENKILEQIDRSRSYAKRMSLGRVVQGDVEFYFQPRLDACGFLLQNAFGGTVTSATATGETVGAGASSAITHTFNIGNMDQSYPSLCMNVRKGPATTGKVFEYNGVRVNELMFTAELNDQLRCKASLIAVNATQTSNDVDTTTTFGLTTSGLSFEAGRLSVEASAASLTSSSFWCVVSTEFGWNNSLKADDDSRCIGSDVLQIMPPGIVNFTLNCKVRFDTTTAYDAMMNATQLAVELEFLGLTLPGSNIRQGLKLKYPKVFVADAGDPEVSGPDELLMSDVVFHVLRDDSSATGYPVQAYLTNQKTSYA